MQIKLLFEYFPLHQGQRHNRRVRSWSYDSRRGQRMMIKMEMSAKSFVLMREFVLSGTRTKSKQWPVNVCACALVCIRVCVYFCVGSSVTCFQDEAERSGLNGVL